MAFFDFFRKRKASSKDNEQANAKEESAASICFVLCETVAPGDLSRAEGVVSKVFGRGYKAEITDEKIVTISQGDRLIGFLAHMPAPVPGGEAEQNADGNFLWPNGKEEAVKHRSHIIVTNFGSNVKSSIQSALNLTRLALVALDLFDGIGVYWGNAQVTNSRAAFEDFCGEMSEDHMPIPMWLRYQLVRASDDEIGMYTLGMDQFGLMNIEVDRCSMEIGDLFEFVSNIAHYLIKSGPVIADGNTVGGSAEERILVHHRPSMIDEKKKVYKIVFNA